MSTRSVMVVIKSSRLSAVATSQPTVSPLNSSGGKAIKSFTLQQFENFIHCSNSLGTSVHRHSFLSPEAWMAHSAAKLHEAMGSTISPSAPAAMTSAMFSQISVFEAVGGIGNRQQGSMK